MAAITRARNISVRDQVTTDEWQTRVDLAAFYRQVAHHGMADLVLGHLSARIPGTTDQFLINTYPRLFEKITASKLVKVNADGDALLDVGFNYDIPAYTIHGAVFQARPDAGSHASDFSKGRAFQRRARNPKLRGHLQQSGDSGPA